MSYKFNHVDMAHIHKRHDLIGRRVRAWLKEPHGTYSNDQIVGIFRKEGIHQIGTKIIHAFEKFDCVQIEGKGRNK